MLTWTIKRAFVSCRTGIYAFFRGIYAYFPGKYVWLQNAQSAKNAKSGTTTLMWRKTAQKAEISQISLLVLFQGYRYIVPYDLIQCNTIHYNTIQYNAIQLILITTWFNKYIYIYGDDLLGLFCSYVHMSTHVLSCRKKLAELHGLAGPHWKSIVQLPVRTGIVGGGRATKASIHVQVSWRVVRQGSLSCGLTLKPFSLPPLVLFYCR